MEGVADKLPSVTEEDDFYRMNNGCQILEMTSNVMAYPQSKNELEKYYFLYVNSYSGMMDYYI